MRKNRGFTLIELLVVIAIIALLLSVLMPALKLVKEKAKNLSCRANIRSLSVGFRLYTEENGGKVFSYGSGGHNLWLMQIEDQLGDIDKVRFCSSTKINPKAPPFTWPNGMGNAKLTWIWPYGVVDSNGNLIPPENVTTNKAEYGSYGFNGWLYSNANPSGAWMSSVVAANSASIPIFVDAMWVDLWPEDNHTVPADHNLETGGGNMMRRCMIDRHGGALSVSFLDGHVEPVDLKHMWSLKWSRAFETDAEEHFREDGTPIYIK
jgi:prepilin-type N-terminal cleavage/methylation domain-containing protein/prepilin-type processing-associated H-X9-DG protein